MSNNWIKTSLGELCNKITKGTTPTTYGMSFVDKGINYIKAESITKDSRIDETTFAFITKETHDKLKRSQIELNDILFSMAGMFLGKTAIVSNENFLPANTNQAVAIIRVKDEIANPFFVFYYLNQKSIKAYINLLSAQSAQPNINLKEISDIEISLPHRDLQNKIVQILKLLDNKIDLNNAINNNLEQQAQALFKSWSNEIDYDYRALSDVSTIKYGKGLPTNKLLKSGYKVFGGNGIIGSYSQYLYEQPQILISCRGAASGTILESYPYSFVTNNSLIIELNDRRYYEFLKRFLFLNQLHSFVTGSAQPQITIDNIRKVEIPYPRYEKIAKLDNALKSISIKIYKNICENEILAQLRDTLLPKLMSGEIDVSKVNVDNLTSADKLSFSKY